MILGRRAGNSILRAGIEGNAEKGNRVGCEKGMEKKGREEGVKGRYSDLYCFPVPLCYAPPCIHEQKVL